MAINRNRQMDEGLLVGVFFFYIIWSFFSGFPFWWQGAIKTMIQGNLGLIFQLIPWIVALVYSIYSPKSFSRKNLDYAILFMGALMLIFIYLLLRFGEQDTILFTCAINGAIIFLMRDELKIRIFSLFIKFLSLLFAFSLVEFIVYITIGRGIITAYVVREGNDQSFIQLLANFVKEGTFFPRFQSLCEEPGNVGTMCGLLFYALPKTKSYLFQRIVFILSGIFSFSLAFYVLLAIYLFSAKLKWWYLLLILATVGLFYYFFRDYVDLLLFNRIGQVEVGDVDNRTTELFDGLFTSSLRNQSLWFGKGSGWLIAHPDEGGAGAKLFIWRYGIFGLICLFFTYFYYYRNKIRSCRSEKRVCWLFFLVLWISFYQRQWIYVPDFVILISTMPLLFSTYNINRISNGK